MRASAPGIHQIDKPVREHLPDVRTLPQHFKEAGYHTVTLGKIYHHRGDDEPGWSEMPAVRRDLYVSKEVLAYQERRRAEAREKGITDPIRFYNYQAGPPVESAGVPDNAYADGAVADMAVAKIREHKDKPFFLAVGFMKPHLPFAAPKRYWDLYEREELELPNQTLPKGAPDIAFTFNWGELAHYRGVPQVRRLDNAWTAKLIHGYYACVSYVDAQVGRLLAAIEEAGIGDKTIVILWGDHGWKLGEYGQWSKYTNFEYDARAPLILRVPRKTSGQRTNALVELVDMYPTLAELCGLEIPDHLEGVSMVPLLDEPGRQWKTAAFSSYPRGRRMGVSMRTDRWRYTEWRNRDDGTLVASELYDQSGGPFVTENLSGQDEYAAAEEALQEQLRAGWKAARPPNLK